MPKLLNIFFYNTGDTSPYHARLFRVRVPVRVCSLSSIVYRLSSSPRLEIGSRSYSLLKKEGEKKKSVLSTKERGGEGREIDR